MEKNNLDATNLKQPKELFKEPHSKSTTYSKDTGSSFLYGVTGSDVFTSHVKQSTNWDTIPFEYEWNSLGLRGPEPDYTKKKKILFAGGSLSFGCGLPVEHTFPYVLSKMMDATYLNFSDVDTLSDLLQPLKDYKGFDPDLVVISDPRFIQRYGWVLLDIYKQKNFESRPFYKDVFVECDKNFLLMFESYLKDLFPNAELVLAYCYRRAFRIEMPDFRHFKTVTLTKKEVVDIARDNAHPGIVSHKNFAEKIYKTITPQ